MTGGRRDLVGDHHAIKELSVGDGLLTLPVRRESVEERRERGTWRDVYTSSKSASIYSERDTGSLLL
jgi:hypothetical protein